MMRQKSAMIKLPVKVGSHHVYVSVQRDTNAEQLIVKALKKCKIATTSKQVAYGLFERLSGIDRLVNGSENVYEIWMNKTVSNGDMLKCELIVKLLSINELRMKRKRPTDLIKHHQHQHQHQHQQEQQREKKAKLEHRPIPIMATINDSNHTYEYIQDSISSILVNNNNKNNKIRNNKSGNKLKKRVHFSLNVAENSVASSTAAIMTQFNDNNEQQQRQEISQFTILRSVKNIRKIYSNFALNYKLLLATAGNCSNMMTTDEFLPIANI